MNSTINQEIFDKVVKHLRLQNCKATNGAFCVYRTSDNLKCAIGCLIEDEEYDLKMEGYLNLLLLFAQFPHLNISKLIRYEKDDNTMHLLARLQVIHDKRNVEDWENEFEFTSEQYNLSYKNPI